MALSQHVSTTGPTTLAAYVHDPILAAIDHHDEAMAVLRSAPAGTVGVRTAERAALDALIGLLGTPCTTRDGAEALLRYLRRHIEAEHITADPFDLPARLAVARAADLSLLLGLPGARAPLPLALPASRGAALQALNRAGEVLAAFVVVIGGGVLIGLASLL